MASLTSKNHVSRRPTFHGFLSLPIEIRLDIYELAVDMEPEKHGSLTNYNRSFSSLPRVSHLVRKECLAINYRRHRFPLLKHWVHLLHDEQILSNTQVPPHRRITSVPDHILQHLWTFQLEVVCDHPRVYFYALVIRRTRGKWGMEITNRWGTSTSAKPLCGDWLKQATRPEVGLTALMGRIRIVLDECPEGPVTRQWMVRLAQTAGAPNSVTV